jgi:hypothetical protein
VRPNDLFEWSRANPFVPFRIHLNGGRTFDIRHPELIQVGRSTAYVFTRSGGPEDPVERMDMISLLMIETVQSIESAKAV